MGNQLPFDFTHPSKATHTKARQCSLIFLILFFAIVLIASLRSDLNKYSNLVTSKLQRGIVKGEKVSLPGQFSGSHTSTQINQTLGFEKVYVLSLPTRLDHKDQLNVIRHASGIDWEIVDGVQPAELKNARLPYFDENRMDGGFLASLRGHIRIWNRMLEENIETALILEDDVDFVYDIRAALQRSQQPLANLLTSIDKNSKQAFMTDTDPWSAKDWDMLQLGACTEKPFTEEYARPWTRIYNETDFFQKPPYLLYDDPQTADIEELNPELRKVFDGYNIPMAGHSPDNLDHQRQRMVTHSLEAFCSAAYAITRRGAARLLYWTSINHNEPVDVVFSYVAQDNIMRMYSIIPPPFGQWKQSDSKGPTDREDPNRSDFRLDHKVNVWEGRTTDIGQGFRSRIPTWLTDRNGLH